MEKTTRKRKITIWAAIAAILLIIVLVCVMYISDYYRADTETIAAFAPAASITEQKLDDGTLAYIPKEPDPPLSR